jgi:hypothetical protein
MAGQPLAWMEASNLPEEAFDIKPVVDKYRTVSADFHGGVILPVGEEPSGRSWTGFQSILSDTEGYVIIYREASEKDSEYVRTWLTEGTKVKFTPVLGQGKSFKATVDRNGEVRFSLPQENTYAFYRYSVSL